MPAPVMRTKFHYDWHWNWNTGNGELGNWGLPSQGHAFPIRTLNGSIDEFAIYHSALSPAEIQNLNQKGQPK